ncbi:hypothetical protein MTP99_000871 [Tenebrio molitor]|nr:hypothetical protein MTP99_000871 [Tenebrio molitor]
MQISSPPILLSLFLGVMLVSNFSVDKSAKSSFEAYESAISRGEISDKLWQKRRDVGHYTACLFASRRVNNNG